MTGESAPDPRQEVVAGLIEPALWLDSTLPALRAEADRQRRATDLAAAVLAALDATAAGQDTTDPADGLTAVERAQYGVRAEHFPPTQLVYSLSSVDAILAARTPADP